MFTDLSIVSATCVMDVFRSFSGEFHHRHQAAFSMIEDVAVKHPCCWGRSGTVVVPYDEAHGFIERHIDRILPGEWTRGVSFFVEDLKEKAMQVDGVRPFRLIRDSPNLGFADRRGNRSYFCSRGTV